MERFNEIAQEKKEIWMRSGRDAPEPRFEEDCLHLAACSSNQVNGEMLTVAYDAKSILFYNRRVM